MKRINIISHFLALVCIVIWGTTFISTKVLLDSFHPVVILVYRLVIAILLLTVLDLHIFKTKNYKHELLFFAAGASGIAFYFLLENLSLSYTSASNVGIIVSAAPFFTMLSVSLILKTEKIRYNFFIGFVIAMMGIVLISINKTEDSSMFGDVLALCAMVMWGLYSVCVRKISDLGYQGIGCTRKILYYGLIILIPFYFIFDCNFNFKDICITKNYLNLIYLGVFASAMCFVFWNYSVRNLGAIKTSVYIYLSPVVTVIFSYFILGEVINYITVIGIILTIFGLVISSDLILKRKKEKFDI